MSLALKAALLGSSVLSLTGHDPYMGYNFLVEVGGVVLGGFSEVSGLGSQIELESYNEGGLNKYVHQFPKHTTHSNLVLTRGLIHTDLFFLWYAGMVKREIERLNGTIILLSSKHSAQIPVMYWSFEKAYPVKWEGPDLNASTENIAVEKIELVHQGISTLSSSAIL